MDAFARAVHDIAHISGHLLADLETIAEAARQLFPSVEPPDTLWEHIESAIKKGS